METTVTKNKQGYGYKYTDLAQIHNYLEQNNMRYYQFEKVIEGNDYVMTQKLKKADNKDEWINDGEPLQGCRVVNATLSGKSNPAQEQGSALTYARRYSLLMAYGLATEDDDGEKLTRTTINETMENALRSLIKNKNIPDETVINTLKKYGYKKLNEIEIATLKKIQDELDKF